MRVAQQERVDLIVLGTKGGGVMQQLGYGGAAFDVLRMSPAPVLVQKFDVVRALGHVECQPQCAHYTMIQTKKFLGS